ncbi:uncharacterized protein LOC116663303 isoform X2 [Camelus ferus]|uniref:Uncharacterized protein LOC116663303 isoform X2 n=1 Tax=Camelus ferus TaxID=419612 RepID=A0A8B8SYG7_CAMFR|nr:uncharacterized protein LOC116663303 isoform X2 [Camelus ferus]
MRAPKSAQTLPGLGTGLPDGWSLPKGAGALPLAISGQQKTGFCSSCGGCGQHPPPQSSQGAGASGCHAWNHSQRGLSSRSPRTRAPEEHRSLSSLQWASCHLFDDPGRAARWEGHGDMRKASRRPRPASSPGALDHIWWPRQMTYLCLAGVPPTALGTSPAGPKLPPAVSGDRLLQEEPAP